MLAIRYYIEDKDDKDQTRPMDYFKKIPLLLITFTLMTMSSAEADWINISGAQNAPNIAEIYINDDHVRIELEIFVKDLVMFDRLIPDGFFAGTKIRVSKSPSIF